MDEPKPCPFCGAAATVTFMQCNPSKGTRVAVDESFGQHDHRTGRGNHAVVFRDIGMREEYWAYAECTKCPAQVPVHVFGSMELAREKALEAWNARA